MEQEELFAGTTAATGAEDAWFLLGLDCEVARLEGDSITGGSADIFKCFDQVQRRLFKRLLRESGCPDRIVEPYMRYLEQMQIYNSVAGTFGEPHKRLCSIPQGCPLSMTMIAFLLHPWIEIIKEIGANPRVLADDIMVWSDGQNQEADFRDAYRRLPNPPWFHALNLPL